jgi:two-component system, OmpR family, phosphate regulon sensor histidine kinase PhoR
MKFTRLNIILVLGLFAIVGILTVQILWTRQAFLIEDRKFSEKVHITLLKVVEELYRLKGNEFPLKNPINQVTRDYFIVNVNNDFDAEVLEHYLATEFQEAGLLTDFEYAIYQCESDQMVYGNYVSFDDRKKITSNFHFPKQDNLVYYFAVRFPKVPGFLMNSLRWWLLLSLVLVFVLVIYLYSIFTILQQKKYSDLQRDFINNMTHEFKTPLSSILIAANYLKKQPLMASEEKLGKYSAIIAEQALKLNNHVENILNIAKTDEGPLQLNKQNIRPVVLIKSVIENIRLKNPELRAEVMAENEDVTLEADEFHFTNLVYNLIDNSVKYSEKQPSVTIRISTTGEDLIMSFSDTGIGVPAKNIEFMFDKFYRVNNPRGSETTGFGLGLYYVKKICTLHRWKISAFNNEDKGLTVALEIPK